MRIGNRRIYAGVLDIPEGTKNGVSIKHKHMPAGTKLHAHNGRTLLFGQKGETITFTNATRWHELHEEDHGLWMTDLPIEQRQIDDLVVGAQGSVLIGGLGLGYVVAALARKPRVTDIVVVERSQDVIDLVWDATIANVRKSRRSLLLDVVRADIHTYVESMDDRRFTWAFFDTWQSDGEITFHEDVLPLRRAARAKHVPVVRCWNEDIMRGQKLNGLMTRLSMLRMLRNAEAEAAAGNDLTQHSKTIELMRENTNIERLATPNGTVWIDWAVPFWAWYRDVAPDDKTAEAAAMFYAQRYGTCSDARLTAALHLGWKGTKDTTMALGDLCG